MSYNHTINEIVTLYELEPDLRDIYVEGITDKLILDRFMEKYDFNDDINVKLISDIDFSEITDKYSFEIRRNNKNKLIALSKEILESKEFEKINNLTIIVDKDFDTIFNSFEINKYVKYTDYNSIELYLFNENSINNFFKNSRGFPVSVENTLNSLRIILKDCFILGAIFYEDKIGKDDRVDYLKSIEIKKTNISFCLKKHLQKDLNKLAKISELNLYEKRINDLKSEILEFDEKDLIRGHDFIEIFHDYFIKVKKELDFNLRAFEITFFQFLDYSELRKENLFRYLEEKYK